jgi:hypothetical protein
MRYIKRGYQKPLEHPLILGAYLHVEHPHLEPLTKKINEGGKAKRDPKDLNVIRGATKFSKSDKPRR